MSQGFQVLRFRKDTRKLAMLTGLALIIDKGGVPVREAGLDRERRWSSAAQLQKLPGIGLKRSQRIIGERGKKPFQTVDELRRVSGIGPKTLEKLRPFVIVGGDKAPPLLTSQGPVTPGYNEK